MEEFEKKLTAVHTKGLENVENEERDQQLESNCQNIKTPVPKHVRRTTRGTTVILSSPVYISCTSEEKNYNDRKASILMFFLFISALVDAQK